MEQIAILKQMGLFRDLDSLELIQVSKLVKHRKYEKDEVVLKEGDHGASLFVVKSGQFRAYVGQEESEKDLAVFKSADSFGELALIDHAPRSATVRAMTRGDLLEFDAAALESLMNHSLDLKLKLLSNLVRDLAAKLRRTNDRLVHLL